MATRPEIIDMVKEHLDEISPFSGDEVDAVSLIDKLLDESSNTLRLAVPVMLLRPSAIPLTNQVEHDDDSGRIPLPKDFLRLHSFKLTAWQRPVFEAIGVTNPKYKLQHNVVTRGGVVKPVVVIRGFPGKVVSFVGVMTLEYYSAPIGGSHLVEYAWCILKATAQEIEDLLVDTLAWQCAGDVYVVQEMPEQAQVAYAKVKEFIDKQTL